jgi:hypothetical protein
MILIYVYFTQNEEDLAKELVGFLQQFLAVFSELKGKKFYVTGESVRNSGDFPVKTTRLTCVSIVRWNICAM